jgi:predicted component of type VI protein secretion system
MNMLNDVTVEYSKRELLLARVPQPGFWRLNDTGGVLGRDENADIVLKESEISRHHCRFLALPHGWLIEDLAATNGTRLNGVPVMRAYLTTGDVVEVSGVKLRVNIVEAPGAALSRALAGWWPSKSEPRPMRRAA